MDWYNKVEGSFVSTDVLRAIAKRFFGGENAFDFSTYDGKALAAKMIQDREYAKECLILCDFSWPMRYIRHSEDMKSEYYQLRGWDIRTGLQRRDKLLELDLSDIAEQLENKNVLVK